MELGNFLGKLKGEDKESPKQFLALVLTDEIVQASVWSVVKGTTEITSVGTPVEWDGDTGTTTELVTAVDATISSAVEGLESEPSQVILGVPHSWTDKSGILGVKKEFISKINEELELKAIGYVVITDSILSYLKMQEGTPTTSILIQVSRDELTLVLVRLGRIEAIDTIGRSDDIVEDVSEGITRFKAGDNLPSRIILFNSMHDLDDLIQTLLSVNWQTNFNFLHTPKIESLAKDVAIRALSVAGGSEVAKSLGITLTPENVESTESDLEDIEPEQSEEISEPVEDPEPELLAASELGFASVVKSSEPKVDKSDFIEPDDIPAPIKPKSMPKITLPTFKLPSFKFSFPSLKRHAWIALGGVTAFCLLVFYLVWMMPKAVISVAVTPKPLSEEVEITLSTTQSSVDFTGKIVPASIESLSESGEKIIETSGTKIVGDPATGEITIFNRTSAPKTFTKDTVISAGSLKFTLDEDVTVASKSAGADYVDVPGKSSVTISASTIGADSNLASATEFTISNFGKDSFVGKNDSALTGGTSQEVQIVSQEDQKALVDDLTQELIAALKQRVEQSGGDGIGAYLIEDSVKVDDSTYSAKVGETAKSLTGNITISAILLKYSTEDVTNLVNSAIDQAVPPGYVRTSLPSTVEVIADQVGEDNDLVQGTAQVEVSLLPVIDQEELKQRVKGKSVSELEVILAQYVPGYVSTTMQYSPRFIPIKFKSVPFNPTNITLDLVPVSN